MSANINVVFTFDSATATRNLKQAGGEFIMFEKTVKGASGAVDGFDKVIQKFSVQTFAQGMLNLSTSAAQVYTSFSNLDRSANQVQASLVALHKAEDQILRKQTQLSQAIEKYGSTSERATMITGELETAQEQLEVKTERHKLAVDQLNDTYILMTSNLINTAFGGFQTLTSMMNMLKTTTTATTAANIAHTAATTLDTAQNLANAGSQTMVNSARLGGVSTSGALIASQLGLIGSNTALTASTWGLTRSMLVNPIFVGAVLIAATVGVAAFTEATKGLNSSVITLSGSLTESSPSYNIYNENLKTTTGNANDLYISLDKLNNAAYINGKRIESGAALPVLPSIWDIKDPLGWIAEDKKNIKLIEEADKKAWSEYFTEISTQLSDTKLQMQKELIGKTIDGVTYTPKILIQQQVSTLENIKNIETETKTLSALTQSYIDHGFSRDESMTRALKDRKQYINLLGVGNEYIKAQAFAEIELGKIQSNNHSNEISNLRQLAEIKKKLMQDYGFTKRGSVGDKFLKGETNYFMGESGIPFSGYINEKTKQLEKEASYRFAFDTIVNAQEIAAEKLKNGEWNILQVSRYLANTTAKLNAQQNLVGRIISIDAQVAMNNQQRIMSKFNKMVNVGGGIGLGAIGLNANGITGTQALKGYSSLGNIMPSRMTQASLISAQGRGSSFPSGTVSGMPSGGARFGRKKHHGKTSLPDSVVRENSLLQLSKGIGSSTISDLSRLSGVDIMAGIGDPMALFTWKLPSKNQYISPAMSQARNRQIDEATRLIAERIAMANSIISSGRSFVGQGISAMEARYGFDVVTDQDVVSRIESSTGYGSSINVEEQVRATLASDEKYYNVDDRLRFTDRLAAISTGATVF